MAEQNAPKNFTFKYVKSPDFKTIKVDGVIGNLNVKREISINFYVDTVDLAPSVIHTINSNTAIGEPIPVEKKVHSAIRELQYAVNIDVQTAKSLVVWLNDKIQEAEKQTAELIEFNNKQASKLIGN